MRVEASPLSPRALPPRRPAAGAGGFRLGEAPARAAGTASAGAATGLDALLALQAADEDAREAPRRRKRALARGHGMLDALDALRLGLLEGRAPAGALGALRAALAERREGFPEPGLEETLAWVELRAAVELAKLERAGGRAA